ncbi:diguanylate cyclase [Bradyrhizobium sp. SZCCHNS1054]|uniref:diguanylate cyclase n=1 Tax=Bradyrhizobium sp. SZCCHNS1054 TaxID=3057301 RepID=UPI002916BDCC|nr:diguanylate cyclase [Bradyrhizobium sp. SZCCHNS1054]
MPIPTMPDEKMRKALKELEQAAYNHEQWAEMIYGTLICRLTPDQRDIGDDAHRMCRFGQWYYKDGMTELEHHPGVAEIGLEHERMHQHAARLLRASVSGDRIEIGDFERFVTAVKRLRLELATVQRELADALFNLDPLTGTRSRTSMLTSLREQRELVKRGVQPCALAMMDLDHFKAINDKYGHAAGDKVLIGFARHIIMHLRPYDKIFRFGGEEFLIFMPDADLKAGHDIVDRLREELGSLRFDANGKEIFQVTVSFGLTLLDPDIPVEQSIDRADNALYVAKAMGRNRVIAWNDSMSASPAASV